VTGASMTPGDVNTGNDTESPLVALTGVTPNPDGTISLTFNGGVSQVLAGDGSAAPATGSGVTITDTSGVPIPVIDARPTATGLGTSTLTLSFTGSGIVGGQLPEGMYQLNFVGNGFVANGRAVDVANNGTQVGGVFEFEFTVGETPTVTGDYNSNGTVDAADYVVWRKSDGQTGAGLPADGDGDGDVDADDYNVWRANFGRTAIAMVLPGAATAVATAANAAQSSGDDSAGDSLAAASARDLAIGDLARSSLSRSAQSVRGGAGRTGTAVADEIDQIDQIDHQLLLAIQGYDVDQPQPAATSSLVDDGSGDAFDVDEIFSELGAEFVELALV
jgi:hypothetical protein